MSNWMHCHRCCALYEKNKELSYFLAECGHVFCENCFKHKDSLNNYCIICKKKSGIIKICKDMDPLIWRFFNPLENEFKKCLEISNYQNSNRDLLVSRFQQKYENAKEQLIKHVTISRKLVQENKMLRTMLRNSAARKKPTSSTPIDCNNTSFKNITASTISPAMMFRFGTGTQNASTSINSYPGVAKKLCISKVDNQSTASDGISPAQVVPKVVGNNLLAPIHRSNLGTMSSWQDLLSRTKTMKI